MGGGSWLGIMACMPRYHPRTSESVSEGHPDKVADQIADALLDAYLGEDPDSRTAIEVLLGKGFAVVTGEVKTKANPDVAKVVRDTIRSIGYTDISYGFDADRCALFISMNTQSKDIAKGVERGGAGDQGMMFGYACNETEELMPMPILLAHKITRRLADARRSELKFLRPDGKSQVTVAYENNRPVKVTTIVVAAQHSPDVTNKILHDSIIENVIKKVIPPEMMDSKTQIYINPTGRFVIGGPKADCGVTGRKIIVDTYGGMGRHGGGCFSGKDPSKVDRSAAYMARYIAKNIVAAGLADRCEIQIAYAIGVARPVSFLVNTFGTAKVEEKKIEKACLEIFDMRPRAIIKTLNLLRPIYKKTAAYGHFGRTEPEFTWEKTDKAKELKSYFR